MVKPWLCRDSRIPGRASGVCSAALWKRMMLPERTFFSTRWVISLAEMPFQSRLSPSQIAETVGNTDFLSNTGSHSARGAEIERMILHRVSIKDCLIGLQAPVLSFQRRTEICPFLFSQDRRTRQTAPVCSVFAQVGRAGGDCLGASLMNAEQGIFFPMKADSCCFVSCS